MAPQPYFGPGCDDRIHPITRTSLLRTEKLDLPEAKPNPDEGRKIEPLNQHVAAKCRGLEHRHRKPTPRGFIHFPGEQSDLALVVCAISEETITFEAQPRPTHHLRHIERRMLTRRFSMPAEKIVAGRNVKMADNDGSFHALGTDHKPCQTANQPNC